jgi:uncharacterized protein YutE (UPF0331/DUF86 family)
VTIRREAGLERETKIRLIKHTTFLEDELRDYESFKSLSQDEYNREKDKRRNVERWIENIINSSIDIAKIILSSENILLPDTYRESVAMLSSVPNFDKETVEYLSDWVRLKNIISHEYLDIRWNSINRFIHEAVPIYMAFLEMTEKYISKDL